VKALVKTGRGKGLLELREVDEPVCGPKEVKLRVRSVGICGTDLHIRDDHFHYDPPVVLGHEFAGEICEVGAEVPGIAVGDRFVAEPHKGGCGLCRHCLTGAVEVCRKKKALGYRIDGSFCPYVTLPAASLHRIPESMTYDQGACVEPLAVGVKAVLERAKVEPEDVVVVFGCGPIGVLAAAAAKAAGARAAIVAGTDADEATRFPCARAMGIDRTVNLQRDDLAAAVDELTGGAGADVVVEASGAPPAVRQAFDVIRVDGRLAAIGLTARDEVELPWNAMVKKAVNCHFSFSSTWTSWERSISLIASERVDVGPLVPAALPLADWERGFAMLDRSEAVKIVLNP